MFVDSFWTEISKSSFMSFFIFKAFLAADVLQVSQNIWHRYLKAIFCN